MNPMLDAQSCHCGAYRLEEYSVWRSLVTGITHTPHWCKQVGATSTPRDIDEVTPALCHCPIKNLTSTGHDAGCPEKRR